MLRSQNPAHRGALSRGILKAERDVASTAAGNCGHEKPGTAARQQCLVAWSLRAGPGNGDGGGTWADNARRSAVRRASRLRGRAHASQAWRRALQRDTYKAGRLWALRQSPRSGVGSDEDGKGRKKTRTQNKPGLKKLGCLTW